ncbi:cyclase family protein [Dactylosporangium siamense]|uniref:Cyclase n=1 Tax=Dactylosporangium siamense TaxID=685454 RepID=A0A919UHW5_9ACTN|nr:cyclase family protein [Dactylosporangium siamense]GIG51088.1 cyclase [Dactylosporangium siamense]
MSRFVELSHPIHAGLVTYPGMPGPVITDYLSRDDSRGRYAVDTTFQIGRIDLIANTGTYLDTPAHRFEGRSDLTDVPLDRVADLPGLLVDAAGERAVDAAHLAKALGDGTDLSGVAVLVCTGWSRHFGSPAYGGPDAPFLTRDAVEWLVRKGPALVGIDSVNIDDVADLTRPAHTGLLDAGIYVVEHLTDLDRLPLDGFRFSAVPPRIAGMGTFTVRAFAVLS